MNVKFMNMKVGSMTRITDLYAVMGAAWTKLGGRPVRDDISPTGGDEVTRGLMDFGISGQNLTQVFGPKIDGTGGGCCSQKCPPNFI